MRIFYFSWPVTLVLDIGAWAFFHLLLSFLMLKLPLAFFEDKGGLFRSRSFEKSGELWEEWFHVRSWKRFLPDGTLFLKSGYDKSTLRETTALALHRFILETKRAELTHWLSILPAFLFFLWNPPWAGGVMILYALLVNAPFILAQRYNRPRLEKLYERKCRLEEKRQEKGKLAVSTTQKPSR